MREIINIFKKSLRIKRRVFKGHLDFQTFRMKQNYKCKQLNSSFFLGFVRKVDRVSEKEINITRVTEITKISVEKYQILKKQIAKLRKIF